MKILILGPSGQIGHELVEQAKSNYEVVTVGRSAADLEIDVTHFSELENVFKEVRPNIVINAIAYTAVDLAETEIEQAFKLNADLPSNLADLCSRTNCLLIHYSTDFVFDGLEQSPWRESDETHPISIYGKSKLAGEKAVQISTCPYLILRTSWVYGKRGSNFLLTMLRLARERESLSVVDDQIGSPSRSDDIAKATIQLCEQFQSDPSQIKNLSGIYHLTASGQTSWYGFARSIFEQAQSFEPLKIKKLSAISTDEYPTAARRPAFSVLDCSRINETFNIRMPQWDDSVINCIKQYYE